jgi:hypothetical protein
VKETRQPSLRLNWLHVLLLLSILAMETAWLAPWVPLLDDFIGVTSRHHSLAGVYLFFLAILLGVTGIRALPAPKVARIVLQMALTLLSTSVLIWAELYADMPFFSIVWIRRMFDSLGQISRRLPAETSLLLIALYIWHRSVSLTESGVLTDTVITLFRRGFVALAFYTSLLLIGPGRIPWEAFAFFFFGIISIALARLLESKVGVTDWRWARRWLALLIGAALLTMAIGLAVLTLLSVGEFAVGSTLLDLVAEAIAVILGFWATFPGYLMEWLVRTLTALAEGRSVPALDLPQPAPGGGIAPSDGSGSQGPSPLVNVAGQVIVLLIFGFIVFSIARRAARGKRQPRRPRNVERESIPIFNGGFSEPWQRVVDTFQRSSLGPRYSTRSVRRIYASLTAYAGELGHPRVPAQTPYDFLPTLMRTFPDAQEEVTEITEAYVRVHYAEEPETEDMLSSVRQDWQRVQRMEPHRWSFGKRE